MSASARRWAWASNLTQQSIQAQQQQQVLVSNNNQTTQSIQDDYSHSTDAATVRSSSPSSRSASPSLRGEDFAGSGPLFVLSSQEASRRDINLFFELRETIGDGSFATVIRVTHRETKKEYALKVIDKTHLNARQKQRLRTEYEVLRTCKHSCIIRVVEAFETERELSFVTELLRGGELLQRLASKKRFGEEETRKAMKCILSAVRYLHKKGIVHRDLKLENMLYENSTSDRLCIIDLGLARFTASDEQLRTPCGSGPYMSPELAGLLLQAEETKAFYQKVIMYTLLAGYPPFYAPDKEGLLESIMDGIVIFQDVPWSTISDEAKDLVLHMLEKDPSYRITADKALEHPWFHASATAASFSLPPPVSSPEAASSSESTSSRSEDSNGSDCDTLNTSDLQKALNRSVKLQRDHIGNLGSPTESSVWKRRNQKRARQQSSHTINQATAVQCTIITPHERSAQNNSEQPKNPTNASPTSGQASYNSASSS